MPKIYPDKATNILGFILLFAFSVNKAWGISVGTLNPVIIGHPTPVPYEEQNAAQIAVFNYLLKRSPGGEWECNVCENFPELAAIKTSFMERSRKNPFLIRLKIKPDLQWSDGKAVSVDDIVFSWKVYKRLLNSENELGTGFIIESVSKSTTPNEFILKLKDFRVDLHSYLQFPIIRESLEESIWFRTINDGIEKYFAESRYTTKPETRGLFLREVTLSDVKENNVTVSLKDKNYRFLQCQNLSDCTSKIDKGEIDLLVDYNPLESKKDLSDFSSTIAKIEQNPSLAVARKYVPTLEMLHINTKNPLFLDKQFKEYLYEKLHDLQFVYPSPRQSMNKQADIFFRNGILNQHNLSPDKATKKRQKRKLDLVYLQNDSYRDELVHSIQQQLQNDKVILQLLPMSAEQFRKEIVDQNNYRDLLLISWHLPFNEIPFNLFHSDEEPLRDNVSKGQNLSNYANIELDKLLNSLLRLDKDHTRDELITKIIQHVRTAIPVIPLFFHQQYLIYNKKKIQLLQYPSNGLPFNLDYVSYAGDEKKGS